jgi:hypothetical protein
MVYSELLILQNPTAHSDKIIVRLPMKSRVLLSPQKVNLQRSQLSDRGLVIYRLELLHFLDTPGVAAAQENILESQ